MARQFTSVLKKNITTTDTLIYTVPVGYTATAIGMTACNTTSTSVDIDIFIRRSSVDYYLIKGAGVSNGGAEVPVGGIQKLILISGDVIYAKSSAVNSIDVALSLMVEF